MTTTTSTRLQDLAPLVGTWHITGGAEGTVTYSWLEGGHFLLQEVDLVQDGQRATGIEVIGHLKPFGEDPQEAVRSRFYDNQGNTLDYVYRMDGHTLHIWAGKEGSPFAFTGTLTEDGSQLDGEWDYAGQGGYHSTMTRTQNPKETP